MMYLNFPSSDDPILAWKSFIHVDSGINSIRSSTDNQSRLQKTLLEKQLASMTNMQQNVVDSIKRNTAMVCGTLDAGFSALAEDIATLGRAIDWGFSVLIHEQRVSNLLAQNIAKLLRIPDMQKERQYHIEQGFKHLQLLLFRGNFPIFDSEDIMTIRL